MLGNGDGMFQAHVDYVTGGFTPSTVVVRDLNGDGRFDLAVRNQASNTVSVLLVTATERSKALSCFPRDRINHV